MDEYLPEPSDQLAWEQAEMNSDETYQKWLDDYEEKTMKLKVGEGKEFKIASAGNHVAVCNAVISIGHQVTTWQGQESIKPIVWLRWEIPGERIEYEKDGEKLEGPMIVWNSYTAYLTERANLYKALVSWRGRPFSEEEKEGFELFNVVGAPCMLNIIHNESGGKTYANIASITPLPKGMDKPDPEMDLIRYDEEHEDDWDKVPEWLQKKIQSQVQPDGVTEPSKNEGKTDFDDDIPF